MIKLSSLYKHYVEGNLSKKVLEGGSSDLLKKAKAVNELWTWDHLHKVRQLFKKAGSLEETRELVAAFLRGEINEQLPPTLQRKINAWQDLIDFAS